MTHKKEKVFLVFRSICDIHFSVLSLSSSNAVIYELYRLHCTQIPIKNKPTLDSEIMANQATTHLFYDHDTELLDKGNKHISINSKSLPLELRNPTSADAPGLLQTLADKRNTKDDLSMVDLDKATIEKIVQGWLAFSDAEPLDRVTYVVLENGTQIGLGGMGPLRTKVSGKRVGDAGVMIDSSYRGKGYAYEALRMMIDHGFRFLKLDVIQVATTKSNVAMRGLMDKKFGNVSSTEQGIFSHGNEYLWVIKKSDWLAQYQH